MEGLAKILLSYGFGFLTVFGMCIGIWYSWELSFGTYGWEYNEDTMPFMVSWTIFWSGATTSFWIGLVGGFPMGIFLGSIFLSD